MSPMAGTSELISVVLSLAVILAVLLVAAYCARRWRIGSGTRGQAGSAAISIVAARPVGWQSSLQIVEADGQRFLIAAGRNGITGIGRLAAAGSSFADLLDGPPAGDHPSGSRS
jgi:flagellar biogenesis protein FliO